MQLSRLTPLRLRLLTFIFAALVVVVLFEPHNLVHAADVSLPEHRSNSEFAESIPLALRHIPPIEAEQPDLEERSDGVYEPNFAYFDRSVVGRQEEEVKQLTDNKKEDGEAAPGSTQHFRFIPGQPRASRARTVPVEARGVDDELERDTGEEDDTDEDAENQEEDLVKRQSSRQIWISANACSAPLPNVTLITGQTPQLTLYVSTSANNQKPGPNTPDTTAVPFVSGFANLTLQTGNEVYMGVSAPALPDNWNGSWSYEIAASVEGQYHNYANNSQFIFMVDTDSESALFITHNFTSSNSSEEIQKWRDRNPFDMYAFPTANWTNMKGLEASYCGLKAGFDSNAIKVNKSITTKFGKGMPAGQFHILGLETNTSYTGFLTVAGSDTENMELPDIPTVRAGGEVFRQFQWTTKADDSCQVIFDLDFCSDVAYAVPSSSQFKFNDTGLKSIYDDQAKALYQNFSNSLDQVACDTASTAQYSLARTCNDCRRDYKSWLCSVLIPRCEDWSASDPWLQERNINSPFADGTFAYAENLTQAFNTTFRERFAYSRSRNPMIDQVIKPGPYRELLPCDDLCFDLVRSCPAQLAFACPNPPAKALTYGTRDRHNLTCNFPLAVVDLSPLKSSARMPVVSLSLMSTVVLFAVVSMWS